MALRANKPNEDAPYPRGAKGATLPPGFCPARSFASVSSSRHFIDLTQRNRGNGPQQRRSASMRRRLTIRTSRRSATGFLRKERNHSPGETQTHHPSRCRRADLAEGLRQVLSDAHQSHFAGRDGQSAVAPFRRCHTSAEDQRPPAQPEASVMAPTGGARYYRIAPAGDSSS